MSEEAAEEAAEEEAAVVETVAAAEEAEKEAAEQVAAAEQAEDAVARVAAEAEAVLRATEAVAAEVEFEAAGEGASAVAHDESTAAVSIQGEGSTTRPGQLLQKRYAPATPCAVTTGVTSCYTGGADRRSVGAVDDDEIQTRYDLDDEIRSRPSTPLLQPLAFAAAGDEEESSGGALDLTSVDDACGGSRASRLRASLQAQPTAATAMLQAMAGAGVPHGLPTTVPVGLLSGLPGLFGAGGLQQRNGPVIRLVPSPQEAAREEAARRNAERGR